MSSANASLVPKFDVAVHIVLDEFGGFVAPTAKPMSKTPASTLLSMIS
jgi:hypothetical protein